MNLDSILANTAYDQEKSTYFSWILKRTREKGTAQNTRLAYSCTFYFPFDSLVLYRIPAKPKFDDRIPPIYYLP